MSSTDTTPPAAATATAAPGDILPRLKQVIVDNLGVAEDKVQPEALLADDLGADSLDQIELVMAIEETFDLVIGDDEADACKTVQDIVALVGRLSATPAEGA